MTRLAGLDNKVAGTDAFGLTNYDKLQADVAYAFTDSGLDLASATTIHITNEFHHVTGTTTIDTITDDLVAATGQQVRLWIKGGPLTIRNNGGGSGNIRTLAGVDRLYNTNEVVAFVYDGALWRESRTEGAGEQLDFQSITASSASITATTEGTSVAIITGNSVTYDGRKVKVEFFAPGWTKNVSGTLTLVFYRDSTVVGQVQAIAPVGTGTSDPLSVSLFDTPPAGAHIYKVAAFVSANAATINAGPGGSGNNIAAYLRITAA